MTVKYFDGKCPYLFTLHTCNMNVMHTNEASEKKPCELLYKANTQAKE